MLEIELKRQKMTENEILNILTDPKLSYEYALKYNINNYMLKKIKFYDQECIYEPLNILALMLLEDEIKRISSPILALIT